jgi:hypothetical protein
VALPLQIHGSAVEIARLSYPADIMARGSSDGKLNDGKSGPVDDVKE